VRTTAVLVKFQHVANPDDFILTGQYRFGFGVHTGTGKNRATGKHGGQPGSTGYTSWLRPGGAAANGRRHWSPQVNDRQSSSGVVSTLSSGKFFFTGEPG